MKDLYYVLMKNGLGKASFCKKIIKQGKIMINKQIIKDPRYLVAFDDQIVYQNRLLKANPFTYIMINKPAGYICANHDEKYPCVIDLIEQPDCYCLGRLDKYTTGLLIITDDKSLSKQLLLPEHHVAKKYLVTTKKQLEFGLIDLFARGIIIDQKVKCLPAKLEIIDQYHCFLTIKEGKYHQIKKMFKSSNNEVVALKRVAFNELELDLNLLPGKWRYLTNAEIIKLCKKGAVK